MILIRFLPSMLPLCHIMSWLSCACINYLHIYISKAFKILTCICNFLKLFLLFLPGNRRIPSKDWSKVRWCQEGLGCYIWWVCLSFIPGSDIRDGHKKIDFLKFHLSCQSCTALSDFYYPIKLIKGGKSRSVCKCLENIFIAHWVK